MAATYEVITTDGLTARCADLDATARALLAHRSPEPVRVHDEGRSRALYTRELRDLGRTVAYLREQRDRALERGVVPAVPVG